MYRLPGVSIIFASGDSGVGDSDGDPDLQECFTALCHVSWDAEYKRSGGDSWIRGLGRMRFLVVVLRSKSSSANQQEKPVRHGRRLSPPRDSYFHSHLLIFRDTIYIPKVQTQEYKGDILTRIRATWVRYTISYWPREGHGGR